MAKVIASAAYCGASGADGAMNWGRKAEKNRYPFGLVTAVRKLLRKIAELLSRGEVELGFQQISELQHASGVEYLGPLPAGLQGYTIWSGGVHSAANDAAAARAFLNTLVSSHSATAIRKTGMDPM